MSPSRLSGSFYFLALTLFRFETTSAQTYLGQVYETNANYSSGSPWFQKLDQLMDYLNNTTPLTGFGNATIGTWFLEQVSGLALCRIDISATDCQNCIVQASRTVGKCCPNGAGAVIWYDSCFLKYSNKLFLGEIDIDDTNILCNPEYAQNSTVFNRRSTRLISWMANETVANANYVAIGEGIPEDPDNHENIYGLMQCTRDLSPGDSVKCLDALIVKLPLCGGKIGGRIDTGSCNLRYEVYPFLRSGNYVETL